MNAGVRMKSSRLRETASSQWRCTCRGSPADCIISSSAWVPRLDCSSHWVQNPATAAAGSAGSAAASGADLFLVDCSSHWVQNAATAAAGSAAAVAGSAAASGAGLFLESADISVPPQICFNPLPTRRPGETRVDQPPWNG